MFKFEVGKKYSEKRSGGCGYDYWEHFVIFEIVKKSEKSIWFKVSNKEKVYRSKLDSVEDSELLHYHPWDDNYTESVFAKYVKEINEGEY